MLVGLLRFSVPVDAADSATVERTRPLLGVQRWDMFSGKGVTQQQEFGYPPGKQNSSFSSVRNGGEKEWRNRLPSARINPITEPAHS
jgi:hypothetical protein